ncbi:MAG: ABC transporter substrate-binding protein [Rhodobacteraceae bacterium]|nr:ABC transporter substrate-binding protein [Paracoccaceae bacterium]
MNLETGNPTLRFGHRIAAASTAIAVAAMMALPAAAPAQEQGGTFIKAIENEPATLDYLFGKDFGALTVSTNIYNTLMQLDYDFQPHPELAESWEISDDGLVYTFQMRQDIQWHDGTPFTAHDVEFSFREMTCQSHNRAKTWCPRVESFSTDGDHTFIITMKEPFAPLLTILSDYNSGTLVRPKHVFEGAVDKDNPQLLAPVVGTGPFKFSKWVQGSHIELVRNENYFKEGLPYLDRVVIQFLPDEAGRLAALESGDIDMLHSYILPYERVKQFQSDPRFQIIEHGNEATGTNENLLMNHDNEYLQHKAVRQAIAHALNKHDIAEAAMFGASKAAHAHIHSGVKWVYFPEYDHPYDPDMANAMLDEAGFPRDEDGNRFSLRLYWAFGRAFEGRAAEVVRSNLRDVGINVEIQSYDRPSFIENVFTKRDFDMAHQLFTTSPDPTLSVVHRYKSTNVGMAFANAAGWVNEDYDHLTDIEVSITDVAERAAVWKQIQEILMDELPGYPLFGMPNMQLVRSGFEDVITGPIGYNGMLDMAYQVQ